MNLDIVCNYIIVNQKIYENEINKKWLELEAAYFPNKSRDHEYLERGLRWQSDVNRIDKPFYCIDYAIAGICAFSFYTNSKNGKLQTKELWRKYIEMCSDDGKLTLKEFISKNKLIDLFSDSKIQNLASNLKSDIEYLFRHN